MTIANDHHLHVVHPELEDILLEVLAWVDQQKGDTANEEMLLKVRCINGTMPQLQIVINQLSRVRSDLLYTMYTDDHGRNLTTTELSKATGMPEDRVRQLMKAEYKRRGIEWRRSRHQRRDFAARRDAERAELEATEKQYLQDLRNQIEHDSQEHDDD